MAKKLCVYHVFLHVIPEGLRSSHINQTSPALAITVWDNALVRKFYIFALIFTSLLCPDASAPVVA